MTEQEIDELARRVADAAVAGYIVWHAYSRVRVIEPVDYEAGAELLAALDPTRAALSSAVTEYRAALKAVADCHKITTNKADEPTKEASQAQWRQVIGWPGEP